MIQAWTYCGHICRIEIERTEDNRRAEHFVMTPDGRTLFADLNPYDDSQAIVEMWIDAGYPQRDGIGPLDIDDLARIKIDAERFARAL